MNTIAKKDIQPQENPADGWYIIEAAGQHPTVYEGKEVMQDLSAEVLAAVAAAGVPAEGLPIDKDHLSLDREHSTEAVGWVRELAICEDVRLRRGGHNASEQDPGTNGNTPADKEPHIVGLAGRIEWTALGKPLIQGRIYKHFSTVYPPDAEQMAAGTFRPSRLIGLALTNQPNNKTGQPPITNRELAPTQTKNRTMEYPTELLAKLGLADGASDEEVMEKVDALVQRAADAEAAKEAAADAEAEAVINNEEQQADVKLSAEEREKCKQQIVTNRAHGLEYTHLLCNSKCRGQAPVPTAPAAPQRRYGDTSKPAPVINRKQNKELAVANRAKELCEEQRKAGKKPDYWTNLATARRELDNKN